MNDFNSKLKKVKPSFPSIFEAILQSSRVWLPTNHMLNTYYDVENSSRLYEDLVTYSRISHRVDITEKIKLVDPLQILVNFYNITVHLKISKNITIYTPFDAKEGDIPHKLYIQQKGTQYYVLRRR